MRVLALDTTTRAGSVALVEDDRIVVERRGDPLRSPAERLPGDLLAILGERAGLSSSGDTIAGIDLFAVASGPGSFTGLRIGIATMQGFACAAGRRMVAASALDALGQIAGATLDPGTIVGAWIDAHRHEVYSGLYRVTDQSSFAPAHLTPVEPPSVGDPAVTLLRWRERAMPAVIIGDGATMYRHLLDGVRVPDTPALAGAIGRMAVACARAALTIDPAAVQPLYIRRPDAEVERDRKSTAAVPTRG